MSMSKSTNQRPKQRQRPSAAGPLKSTRSGDGTYTRRRADSSTATETTRNTPTQVTRKNTNQMTVMTRSTSTGGSTAEMFTVKSRYTHTSRGVQAQTRGTRENTRDMLSPPLTRSSSKTRTSDDMPTRSHTGAHANPMNRTISISKTRASSSQKSKALSPLENFV